MGTPRVSIYLFSSATLMNSLTKLLHQVDAELGAFQIGTKVTVKTLKTLKELNVKLAQGPILVSDLQTCLSLCSRPNSTLDLSTSLIVSRVQEVFSYKNLFVAPGTTFRKSVDFELIQNRFKSRQRVPQSLPATT